MNGCEGCFISARGQQEQLEQIRTQAKKYAIENEKTVAIYKEGFQYRFIEADKAGGLIIIEIVSQYQ